MGMTGGSAMDNAADTRDTRAQALVVVVDDDEVVRDSLTSLFRSVDMNVRTFMSADQLLAFPLPDVPTCIILDVRLKGTSGLDLQTQLKAQGKSAGIIFITGFGDVPMTVAAMKAGAVDFITKPFRDQQLLDAVNAALEVDGSRRLGQSLSHSLKDRFEAMSERQKEVMQLAVGGLLNKQIADQLNISDATVKIHRREAMRKMQAQTFADLVIMGRELGLAARRGNGS
nr:response regulator [Cupriavidus sp. 2SB]